MSANSNKTSMKETLIGVAHDLRSPLLTVKEIVGRYAHIMSQKDLEAFTVATTRATEICDDTLIEIGMIKKSCEPMDILSATEKVVTEFNGRNTQLKSPVTIHSHLAGNIETPLNTAHLTRMISNLLENSLRAIDEQGRIEVILTNYNHRLFVTVKDTGQGIPPEQLEQLGDYGATFTQQGSGFALWNIKQTMEKIGGEWIIHSIEKLGTQVTLAIPLIKATDKTLNLSKFKNFVLVDDDGLIHELIDFCLDCIGFNGQRYFFKDRKEFEQHMNQLDRSSIKETCFVVDGHLGRNHPVGLRLIRSYNITHQSVLFTGDERIKSLGSRHTLVRCKSESPFDFLKLA